MEQIWHLAAASSAVRSHRRPWSHTHGGCLRWIRSSPPRWQRSGWPSPAAAVPGRESSGGGDVLVEAHPAALMAMGKDGSGGSEVVGRG